MTNTELVAYIRDALDGPKQYPWWVYFQPAIMVEIANQLEGLSATLLVAAERIVAQSEALSHAAEKHSEPKAAA